MQTRIIDLIRDTPDGREADRILRNCVHCGFCNAVCPTYELLGDERDGPRGRIYLVKQVLEGARPTAVTQHHLDRCLVCRACESACPSGVEYSRLLEVGRGIVEEKVSRGVWDRLRRRALLSLFPYPSRLRPLYGLARAVSGFLPEGGRRTLSVAGRTVDRQGERVGPAEVLLLEGCVQSVAAPSINAAARGVLTRLGIGSVRARGCCGALEHHLNAPGRALARMKANIDRWWPLIGERTQALVLTASGCLSTVRDYGRMLAGDAAYAGKAEQISELAMDACRFLEGQDLSGLGADSADAGRVAVHLPCSMQHANRDSGRLEALLERLGFEVVIDPQKTLCCGSAGSYSLLQRELSAQLRERKAGALKSLKPDLIVTANVGCLLQIQQGADIEVRHWLELLAAKDSPASDRNM